MTTFADLQNEVLLQLEGYVNDQVVVAKVGTGIIYSDTTIVVTGGAFSDGSGLSTGVWEIEDELVFVPDFNRTTGTATNVIRGWRGTAPVAHEAGAVVRDNPRFPIVQVRRAINDTVRNLYPRVPGVKTVDLTVDPNRTRYQLPAEARGVWKVSLSGTADQYAWADSYAWRFEPRPGGGNDGFTAVDVSEYTFPGATMRVAYTVEPSPMSSASDNFETVTGLEAFVREAVVLGAVWRLYSMVELGRGFFSSADQTMMNQTSDFGKATDISKYLLGMFQQAVTDAESRMQDMYPPQRHFVWR